MVGGGGDYVGAELGVEDSEFLYGDVEHFGDLVEVQAFTHGHGVGHERLGGEHGADIVVGIIVHHVVGGYEHGHISASLFGEEFVD